MRVDSATVDDAQERAFSRMRNEGTPIVVDTATAPSQGVEFRAVNDDQYLALAIPPPTISESEARSRAEQVLLADQGEPPLRLVRPFERPRQWVWAFQPAGPPSDTTLRLTGQSAIAISKLDGRVRRLWSGRPIEDQV